MASIDFSSVSGRRALERLRTEQVIWLTTVSAAGAPQPSPVWFLWRDDAVLIFSQPDTPKVRAIRRNARVSLTFNSDGHGGDVAIFTANATLDNSGPRADEIPAYIEKYRGGLEGLDMSPAAFAAEFSQAIVVRLASLRAW